MECTKMNCPMQAGTTTDRCGDNCPWRTTAKKGDLISRAAAIEAFDDERVDRYYGDVSPESVIKVIESIPAVDAIPISWIYAWSNKRYRETQRDVSIVDVLAAWQKEVGEKDG